MSVLAPTAQQVEPAKAPPAANWIDVFRPNRAVSKTMMQIVVAVQVALALLIWWLSPWAVLPTPPEVFSALGRLWTEEGLGRELITSFMMNLEALAMTLIVSLGLAYLSVLPAVRPLVAAVAKGRFLGLIGLTFVFTLMVGGGRLRILG